MTRCQLGERIIDRLSFQMNLEGKKGALYKQSIRKMVLSISDKNWEWVQAYEKSNDIVDTISFVRMIDFLEGF